MADSFSGNLNLTLPEVGFANNTWGGTSGLNRDLTILDSLFQSNGLSTAGPIAGSGHPNAGVPGVGLRVGVGYTLNVEGFALFKDHTDVTKVATLDSSLITTATTRTLQFPDENGIIATKGWVQTRVPTGTVMSGYYGAVAPPGFVLLCGRTIGDATSAATERANADTLTLFTLLWTVTATAVSGGRGASAAADWAAHKALTLPDHRACVMAGLGNLGGTDRGLLTLGSYNTRGTVIGTEKTSIMDGPNSAQLYDRNLDAARLAAADAAHAHANTYVMQPTIMVDAIIAL